MSRKKEKDIDKWKKTLRFVHTKEQADKFKKKYLKRNSYFDTSETDETLSIYIGNTIWIFQKSDMKQYGIGMRDSK